MKTAILCIGNELLNGSTFNKNLALIGQELGGISLIPEFELTVPDSSEAICHALDIIMPEFDVLITTGGLGPTSDDISKEILADYLGLKLVKNRKVSSSIKDFWTRKKRGALPEGIMKQALIPSGAKALPNRIGTAPGIHIENKAGAKGKIKDIFMLPGPPYEAIPILKEFVIPFLKSKNLSRTYTEIIYIAGIPESFVESRTTPLARSDSGIEIGYSSSPEIIKIFLRGKNKIALAEKSEELRTEFRESVLQKGHCSLVEELSALLKRYTRKIAVAESCTGGMIASAITDMPGASDIFAGSVVSYSNEWKIKCLGVKKETLAKHGAVSKACAEEMINGLLKKYGTDTGIAVTGIAGPGGGSKDKPVGTVFIATGYKRKTVVKKYSFSGNREIIRKRTVYTALNQLRQQILFEISDLIVDSC